MRKAFGIFLCLFIITSCLPQAVLAQYTMIFQDDFQGQIYQDAYATANKTFPDTVVAKTTGAVWADAVPIRQDL